MTAPQAHGLAPYPSPRHPPPSSVPTPPRAVFALIPLGLIMFERTLPASRSLHAVSICVSPPDPPVWRHVCVRVPGRRQGKPALSAGAHQCQGCGALWQLRPPRALGALARKTQRKHWMLHDRKQQHHMLHNVACRAQPRARGCVPHRRVTQAAGRHQVACTNTLQHVGVQGKITVLATTI